MLAGRPETLHQTPATTNQFTAHRPNSIRLQELELRDRVEEAGLVQLALARQARRHRGREAASVAMGLIFVAPLSGRPPSETISHAQASASANCRSGQAPCAVSDRPLPVTVTVRDSSAARVFRVFISSTFLDLATERRLLEREVFRPLTTLCADNDARFQAVDLRWGVSAEAARAHATMTTCLTEVERCRTVSPWLHFLLLLGDRRGWLPVPAAIDESDFAALAARISDLDRRMLQRWFRRDGNSFPTATWVLRELGPDEAGAWKKAESELHPMLADAAVSLPEDRRHVFQQSAVEQEVSAGIFAHPGSAAGARAVFLSGQAHMVDAEQARRVADLKERVRDYLPDGRTAELTGQAPTERDTDYRDRFVQAVLPALRADVEAQLETWDSKESTGFDMRPPSALKSLSPASQQALVGRSTELQLVEEFLDGEDGGLLTVVGPSGTGKTALLAAAAAAAHQRALDRQSQPVVVARALGTTPATSALRTLLPGLVQEIAAGCGIESPMRQNADYADMVTALEGVLRDASRPVYLILDAVDQLSPADASADLAWLPDQIPPNVRIVLSVLREKGQTTPGATVAVSRATKLLKLAGLQTPDAAVLLAQWLGANGRTLTTQQRDSVLAAFEREGRPLWLRLAVEDCRHWRSDQPAISLPTSLDDLIGRLYRRLSAPAARGPVLVRRVLSLLAASNGLSEDELLDALSADDEVMREVRDRTVPEWRDDIDRFPVVLWAQLASDLLPFLTERGDRSYRLLDYYHRQLRTVAHQWTGGPKAAGLRHRELAALFRRRADPAGQGRWAGGARPLSQLALHLAEARMDADLARLLTDFRYLETVCATVEPRIASTAVDQQRQVHFGGALWLRERIVRAQKDGIVRDTNLVGPMLQAIERALRREAGVLATSPEP